MPEEFPNKDEIEFKPKFEERYQGLLGDSYEKYKRYSLSFLRRSIRVNTLKITVDALKKRMARIGWRLTPVPWCAEGFWVEHDTGRRDIGTTREYMLGYYYVQEAASMIPPIVLDPKEGELILDMCASPGSKTTQVAQYMKNTGLLIANDINGKRMQPLGLNMQRMGITNSMITMMRGQRFARTSLEFDRILLDAPCSGTGTIRKSVSTLRRWNPQIIKKLASIQKQLILIAFDLIKPGGTMVYSTCSSEPEENEAVVDYLLRERGNARIVEFDLEIKRDPLILEFEGSKYDSSINNTLRIWPQTNDTEGFYISKITKG